jgi:CHAD domain-containing protein
MVLRMGAAIHTDGADAIHDLRVAIRRFAQSMAVFKASFPQKESRKIRRRLKAILTLAGEVRDCDIALETLTAHGETALAAELRARRKSGQGQFIASLKRWVTRHSLSKWRRVLRAGAGSLPVEESAQRELCRLAKGFFREGSRAAGAHATAGELHEFRIAAKKLRYTLELFQGLYGPAAEEWLVRIRDVQSLLGSINDYRAVRSLVSDLNGDPRIAAALRRKQHRKTEEFRRLWAATFSGGVARQWIHSLRRPPRKPIARSAGSAAPARKHA